MKTITNHITRLVLVGLLALSPQLVSAQTPAAAPATAAKKKTTGKVAPAAPVDLNSASEADLEKVPGIGAATAKKIVANRPYASTAELSKAGMSAKAIKSLSPMVTTGAAAAPVAAPKPVAKAPATKSTPTPAVAAPVATPKAPTVSTPAVAKPAVQPPGPGMVWVNTSTKVFHKEGSKFYGNTKHGKYLSEAEAIKAGYRESKREPKTN